MQNAPGDGMRQPSSLLDAYHLKDETEKTAAAASTEDKVSVFSSVLYKGKLFCGTNLFHTICVVILCFLVRAYCDKVTSCSSFCGTAGFSGGS